MRQEIEDLAMLGPRNLRRRLNDDEAEGHIFNGPSFFGKTPIKDIGDKLTDLSLTGNFMQ
jgi:hypothetical protein